MPDGSFALGPALVPAFGVALWQVLLELSPSLLFGLLLAGLMHVYLPAGLVQRGLSRPDFTSVARASLIGVPLPLCSCGVIPTALGLHRDGASRGATTAFLIATPQTGVDSILVSAAFLGWPFALFKLVAAFVTGLVGGALVNRIDRDHTGADATPDPAAAPTSDRAEGLSGAVRYAIFDLLAAIDRWLIVGVLLAALITTLVPADFFAGQAWADGPAGMLVVLAIALPLYVCTTASVPIAASLIAAGMPAGSALVFLMAGPATNIATIGAVWRTLGGRVLAIYLGTVIVMSLGFGLTFDALLATPITSAAVGHQHGPDWLGTLSALLLLGLLGWLSWRRYAGAGAHARPRSGDDGATAVETTLHVKGMTCGHCVASVKRALESIDGVASAEPDLASGQVRVRGASTGALADTVALTAAVEQAGFQVVGTGVPSNH